MTRPRPLLLLLLLAANLALVAWWTIFMVGSARELEIAGRHLAGGDVDAAARALGAESAAALPQVARARRRMFLAEGVAFAVIVLAAGALVGVLVVQQARRRADHDRFLAGATHELKTPLATIRLLLESLRDERLPRDKRDRYLQSGLLEAARLEAGLDNVLVAGGLRAGAARRAVRSEGDLADDVERAVAAVTPRADAAGVQLVAATVPLRLVRDQDAVQLVLHNLLDNAIKFSPRGATVRVSLAREHSDAVLVVRDDGAGMDGEALANAFVPFWRGHDSGTGTGGTGLGLFLVRELVRAHGGQVEAHSQGRGQGSKLVVRLPCRGGAA